MKLKVGMATSTIVSEIEASYFVFCIIKRKEARSKHEYCCF